MASSVVIATAKQLGSLVANEAQYLYEVSDNIERLQRDLRWMHCFLEDADNRQHREKVVAMWVAEIRDFAYEAEEVLERYVHKVSHPRQNGWWNSVKWLSCALCDARALHQVGSSIDDLRSRITELISRLQLYGLKVSKEEESLVSNLTMREQRPTYSHIKEDPIGLETHTEEVVKKLVSDKDVTVVGICGMGGLGKTTLARQVFQHKSTRECFKNNCVWVCISKQFETRVVFREILMGLANVKDLDERMELRDLTDGQLPQKICGILTEKDCLVVLDDLWNNDDWDDLKSAFGSITSSGSKILITTRNSGLTQHADARGYSHDTNLLLNDEDSWELLKRISDWERVISKGDDMKTKENLGRQMLEHCKGLPLAILTLGGVLSNKKTIAEWKIVKKNIKPYLMGDMEHGNESKGLFAMLELSYKDLPYYLKPCFMYLGNFPEDYDIKAERLYHLWEAEELVTISADDDGDEIQEGSVDDIAELYLNELVKRCLVQVSKCWENGRIKSCRLHDVMRDVCLKKCKEVSFLNIVKHGSPKEPSSKIARSSHVNRKLRRCALHLTETESRGFSFDPSPNVDPCIRSLLVFPHGGDSEPKKLLSPNMSKFFSLLRVLDLQGACIAMRPTAFKDLIHLRYLSFKKAKLIPLLAPHIWDCLYLETLDLRWDHDYEEVVFSNMFCKLERLRHLYLPRGMKLVKSERLRHLYILRGMKRVGSGSLILTDAQLRQMETLKNFSVKVCQVTDLQKMTSLRVFIPSNWNSLSTWEVKQLLTSPMIATKRLIKPLHLPVWTEVIDEEKALLLTLMDQDQPCISGFDVIGKIPAANFVIFHNILKRLWLQNSEIEMEGILVLEKLPHLTQLTLMGKTFAGNRISFSSGGFPELKHLNIRSVEEVEEWEIGEAALPKLETLRLVECINLKMVPDGLPSSVYVECEEPCIRGVEKYNICRYSAT